MQTSINLQDSFIYLLIPLIVAIIISVGFTTYLIYTKKKRNKIKQEMERIKAIPEKNVKNIPVIKNKYLEELNVIEDKYTNSKISLRETYNLISETIRLFVFEVTDITIQNYSLEEIRKIIIPELYILIQGYYEPEFAYKIDGDFKSCVNKAREIVNEWK